MAVKTPVRTDAPAQLVEFLEQVRRMGARGYKGEFVATDGTRIPLEVMFERPVHSGPPGKGRDDG